MGPTLPGPFSLNSLSGRCNCELAELLHSAGGFFVHILCGIKILHFRRQLTTVIRSIKIGDRTESGLALFDTIPEFLYAVANRGDGSHACYYNSSIFTHTDILPRILTYFLSCCTVSGHIFYSALLLPDIVLHRHTAVRGISCQEQNRLCDILRSSHFLKRDLSNRIILYRLRKLICHICPDKSRCHGIHTDIPGCQFSRYTFRQTDQSRLGGGIISLPCIPDDATDRRDIDDFPISLLHKGLRQMPDHVMRLSGSYPGLH